VTSILSVTTAVYYIVCIMCICVCVRIFYSRSDVKIYIFSLHF